MDGQEPQNNSGRASAAGFGPDHGHHSTAAVARPRPGRGPASRAGSGRTDSPRRGSYRRGDGTADRRSNTGLRARIAAPTRQSGARGPLDRRAPTRAAPDLPHASRTVRHGACRGGPDVRGIADDALPGDGDGHQPGDQDPAGQRDPHRRTPGPADRGAGRAGPCGRARQASVPRERRAVIALPSPGSDPPRPDGRAGRTRRHGCAERRRGPAPQAAGRRRGTGTATGGQGRSGTGRRAGPVAARSRQDGPGGRPLTPADTVPHHRQHPYR